MAKYKRPLNKAAIAKADDDFYKANPSYVGEDGSKKPIDSSGPKADEWGKYYVKHGGELEQDSNEESTKEAGESTESCPEEDLGLYDAIEWKLPEEERPGSLQIYVKGQSKDTFGLGMWSEAFIEIKAHQVDHIELKGGDVLQLELLLSTDADPVTLRANVNSQEERDVICLVSYDDIYEATKSLNKKTLQGITMQCCIPVKLSESGSRVDSSNIIYPLVQKALYFLPGVLGSELSVRNHKGSVEECFPELSMAGKKELELLVCKPDGEPLRPVERDKLKILDNVLHVENIYECEEIVTKLKKKLPSEVFLDAAKKEALELLHYRDVPYDWRLNIANSHKDIAKEIKGYFDELLEGDKHPFLAPKLSISGHSTGGVIMRGLANTSNELHDNDLIEHMFFINVPHLGAPKAEFVLLTGDMEVPLVTSVDSFRQMAPDMPIIYFLTACTRYGTAVDRSFDLSSRKKLYEKAIKTGAYETKKRELYGYPEYANQGPLRFNMDLAKASEKYTELTAGKGASCDVACYTFHSGGHPTISFTSVEGTKVVGNKCLIGDGTVPSVSQIADLGSWKNSRLFKPTPKAPEHVPAPNSEWIWERTFDVLLGECDDSHFMEYPKNMLEMNRILLKYAKDTNSGCEHSKKSVSLPAGSTREYEHEDVDYGIALIECKSGMMKIDYSRSIWSKADQLGSETLKAGEYSLIEIPEGGSKLDQDNLLEIKAMGETAEYDIEFVSVDH